MGAPGTGGLRPASNACGEVRAVSYWSEAACAGPAVFLAGAAVGAAVAVLL